MKLFPIYFCRFLILVALLKARPPNFQLFFRNFKSPHPCSSAIHLLFHWNPHSIIGLSIPILLFLFLKSLINPKSLVAISQFENLCLANLTSNFLIFDKILFSVFLTLGLSFLFKSLNHFLFPLIVDYNQSFRSYSSFLAFQQSFDFISFIPSTWVTVLLFFRSKINFVTWAPNFIQKIFLRFISKSSFINLVCFEFLAKYFGIFRSLNHAEH